MIGELNKFLLPGLSLTILAPPGWGKTSLILNMIKNSDKKFIFVSPLKEINLEIYKRFQHEIDVVLNPQKDKLISNKLIISSAETFHEDLVGDRVIVLDEIHLFYHWGESFRPHLYEILYTCFNGMNTVFNLTATLNQQCSHKLFHDLKNNFHDIYVLNLGNLKLKRMPQKVITVHPYLFSLYQKYWPTLISTKNKTLIFVKTRFDVDRWEKDLKKDFKKVIGCKSESGKNWGEIIEQTDPDIIISTSVLSHGVNLGAIGQVIFTYKEIEEDFWLQMMARAGRTGENFEVLTMVNYLHRHKFRDFFYNIEIILKMIYGLFKL